MLHRLNSVPYRDGMPSLLIVEEALPYERVSGTQAEPRQLPWILDKAAAYDMERLAAMEILVDYVWGLWGLCNNKLKRLQRNLVAFLPV